METEEESQPVKEAQQEDLSKAPLIEPEEGAFETYANVINLSWTLTDVRIRFGELVQQPIEGTRGTWTDQETAILERAMITVPWQQAKFLATGLSALLKKYEELNGEIGILRLPRL